MLLNEVTRNAYGPAVVSLVCSLLLHESLVRDDSVACYLCCTLSVLHVTSVLVS